MPRPGVCAPIVCLHHDRVRIVLEIPRDRLGTMIRSYTMKGLNEYQADAASLFEI